MPDKQPSEEAMRIAKGHSMPHSVFGECLAREIDALIAVRVNMKIDDAIGKVRDWQLDVNPFDQICEGIRELKIKESA